MRLKDFIEQGYTIITSGRLSEKIKMEYPNAKLYESDFDGSEKILIDKAWNINDHILQIMNPASDIAIRRFTRDFCGALDSENHIAGSNFIDKREESKRKFQSIRVVGTCVDLIEEVIVNIIKMWSHDFFSEDDICHNEFIGSCKSNNEIVFNFWSCDKDLPKIKELITDVYDVKIY